jgi:predicted metal-dependent peptidase
LPALRGTPVHLAVVIDSSGSMDQHDLDQAASDVAVLRRLPGVDRVTVVSCDTEAAEVDLPRRGGGIALLGGGGTSLGAGLDLVARLRSRPDLVVVITDGHTDWPERRPSRCAPVVALIPAGGPPGPEWMTTWSRAVVTSPVHEVSDTSWS